MRTATVLLLSSLALSQSADPPPPGQRAHLTEGQLFVPAGFRPAVDGVELVLHLHGGTVAEQSLVRSGRPAVAVSVAIPGLSSVYAKRFEDPKVFARVLAE